MFFLWIFLIITWSKATLYTTLCMESTLHKLICVKVQHLSVRLYVIFLLHIKIITKRSFLTLILLRALNSKIMVYNLLYNLKLSKLIVVNKTIVVLLS